MPQPFLYTLARPLLRLAARAYFRRLEIVGAEHVPRGPVLLAANHPQSITDALVLGLATRRVVHYVAHSGLFENPVQRWLLAHCGVLPIHRPRDVQDAAARNEASFRACRTVLENGGCLGIFPEGTSREERRVQDFRTGTVRIALDAERASDFTRDVAIVPVGLSFQSHARFRSRVLVRFGEPLRLADHRDDFDRDEVATVRQLTEELQRRVRSQVVDVRQHEFEDFVRDIEHVYRGELLDREDLPVPGGSRYQRGEALSREIAKAVDYFCETRPELIVELRALLRDYRRKLERFRLSDRIVREQGASFRAQATRLAALFLIGLPVAIWGIAFNYLPYRLTGDMVRLLRPDSTKIHATQIAVGGALFGLSYGLYAAWIFTRADVWSWPTIATFFASLPLSGIFARRYWIALGRRRVHVRWAYLQSTRGPVVRKLLALRAEILQLMDGALEEYLHREGNGRSEREA